MVEIITLGPGITLRCVRDSRFKQECISFQIVRSMAAEEAAMNALIPNVLLRGTRKHPDLRSVTRQLDDLYGAAVSPVTRRLGDYQATGIYCSMMDERFALPGDRVRENVIAFLGELLFDSPLQDGGFLPSFVEGEKRNLISVIESERNDKRSYAMTRLLRAMGRNDSFGLPRLGEKEQVERIEAVSLYRHYRRILTQSRIDIFYVGSCPATEISALLAPLVADIPRDYRALPGQTALQSCPGSDLTETMDVTQGQLCMGFTTPITMGSPEFASMQLLNAILGAGMTSKLFMNVREKLSLCYYIGSGYYGTKGILTVSAGIDFGNEQLTRQEILRQLEACRSGDITDAEIHAARQSIISGLRSIADSPAAIEGFYAPAALNGLNMTHEEYIRAIRAVEKQQLVDAARLLTLHSTYFLKGAGQ